LISRAGDVIVSMSGDLQHDPDEIPRFLEKIEEGYDLVSGWLYQRRGHWLLRQVPKPRGELDDGKTFGNRPARFRNHV